MVLNGNKRFSHPAPNYIWKMKMINTAHKVKQDKRKVRRAALLRRWSRGYSKYYRKAGYFFGCRFLLLSLQKVYENFLWFSFQMFINSQIHKNK